MQDAKSPDSRPASSLGGCLFQLVWSMLGPGLVLIFGSIALVNGGPVGSVPDWLLLGAVALSIAARWADPAPVGERAPGEPGAPPRGRYVLWVAGGAALLFVLAHFVVPAIS